MGWLERKFSVIHKEDHGHFHIYDVKVTGEGARKFHVEITATQKAAAKPTPEDEIKRWLRRNPLPKEGETMQIQHLN